MIVDFSIQRIYYKATFCLCVTRDTEFHSKVRDFCVRCICQRN
jgi:hypothetical protein